MGKKHFLDSAAFKRAGVYVLIKDGGVIGTCLVAFKPKSTEAGILIYSYVGEAISLSRRARLVRR